MNLIMDIGNTDTKIAIADKDIIIKTVRISTNKNDFKKISKVIADNDILNVFISSVVDDFSILAKEILLKTLCKNIFILRYTDIEKIIKLDIEHKEKAGIDRLINAAGAFLIYKNHSIIVDFGTATKIDVIKKDGTFLGGIIMPGVTTGVKNMISSCEKIKNIVFKIPKNIIGKNTADCINSGMYYGVLYSVKGIINEIKTKYNFQFNVIAAGGLSILFKNSDIFDYYDEYFTLKAMNKIANLRV